MQFAIANSQFAISDAGDESFSVLGHVRERNLALALFRAAASASNQTRQPSVRRPIGRPEDNRRGVDGRDLGADHELQPRLFGRHVRPNHPGQTVAIGNRQCRVTQLCSPTDQLIRMRGAFEEGEVRFDMQSGVTHQRHRLGVSFGDLGLVGDPPSPGRLSEPEQAAAGREDAAGLLSPRFLTWRLRNLPTTPLELFGGILEVVDFKLQSETERDSVRVVSATERAFRSVPTIPNAEVEHSRHAEEGVIVAVPLFDFHAERIAIESNGLFHVFDDLGNT